MPRKQRFKPKATAYAALAEIEAKPERPVMPAYTFAQKRAGDKRAEAALEHLREAREALDAACRDLCAVIGANREYRDIRRLSESVRGVHEGIDQRFALEAEPFVLDREPTDEEIAYPHRRGCGRQS